MIYGFAELGCGSDLGRAFDIVSTFVDTECMFGFEAYERGNPSGYLLEKKDRIIAFEVNRYYQEAKKIIAENRRFLDEMVAALMENQTITYKDIQEIKQRIYLSNLEVKHG